MAQGEAAKVPRKGAGVLQALASYCPGLSAWARLHSPAMWEFAATLASFVAGVSAATWSAIAAIASAVAAWSTWRINRNNLHHSVRPDLVLDGWRLETKGDDGSIHVRTVTNYGRGPALHVMAQLTAGHDSWAGISWQPIEILPAGQSRPISAVGHFSWSHDGHQFGPTGDRRLVGLRLSVFCWDTLNYRHELRLPFVLTHSRLRTKQGGLSLLLRDSRRAIERQSFGLSGCCDGLAESRPSGRNAERGLGRCARLSRAAVGPSRLSLRGTCHHTRQSPDRE